MGLISLGIRMGGAVISAHKLTYYGIRFRVSVQSSIMIILSKCRKC